MGGKLIILFWLKLLLRVAYRMGEQSADLLTQLSSE